MMKKERNEFLGLLCNLYLIALLAALPLYTGEGYWKLGDTKYILFRNVSVLCLGCWLVLGMPGRVRAVLEWIGTVAGKQTHTAGSGQAVKKKHISLSIVDWAMAAYGVCVTISALCSAYGRLAWTGYEEWYMGAFSQLMFVGIYFFVSRQYDGSRVPLYVGVGAFGMVTVLGLLHRLGIDPLGLQTGWNSGDWEYNHMLSTLGNINWLCGFYSVALAWLMVCFMGEQRRWLQVLWYMAVVAAFVLLGIQGSQGGLLILAVGVGVCLVLGVGQRNILKKLMLLLAGFFLCMPLIDLLTKLRGKKAAVAVDGNVFDHTVWYGWVLAAAVCGVVYLLMACGILHKGKELVGKRFLPGERKKVWPLERRVLLWGAGGIFVLCCLVFAVCGTGGGSWRIDDRFGSGRGLLWRVALEGFDLAGWKDKLLGAGPDCYAEAVFNRLAAGTDVWNGEHWEGAIFTNAHNEILSQLINVGIMGTVSYLAIFFAGLLRYCGNRNSSGGLWYVRWLGVLAIAMYGAHGLISFQQVLNAPILFVTLGLCEYGMRCYGDLENTEADNERLRK